MSVAPKRSHDDVDVDAEIESHAVKAAKSNDAHPTHPFFILEYLVKVVLPEWCKNDNVKAFYKAQLEHPDDAIKECKSKLASWVLELWDKGALWKFDKLKKFSTSNFPRHTVVYLILLEAEESEWRYVGQSQDGYRRIVKDHESPSYRRSHSRLLYLVRERAQEASYLLLVSDPALSPGPILNLLEQWISLIFRSLQPSELKSCLAPESWKWILRDEQHRGVNVREPLAQGFAFHEYPMRGTSFRYSPISLKREWYEIHRNQEVIPRQDAFLRGDIFEGSFWKAPGWYGNADLEFQVWSVKLRIGKSWIDRYAEETIRVWCDLRPDGEIHPSTIVRGKYPPPEYNDPARRLGIKVSGTRKGDLVEGWCWLQLDGSSEKSIPRVNRLVDWLDGLDTEELRPRRWYPANRRLGRPVCGYTQHPADVGEAWRELVGTSLSI